MKKLLISSLIFISILTPSNIQGATISSPVSTLPTAVSPHSADEDVIVYKFRTYNGKTQYRRWNETRQKWVDPYWIDLTA